MWLYKGVQAGELAARDDHPHPLQSRFEGVLLVGTQRNCQGATMDSLTSTMRDVIRSCVDVNVHKGKSTLQVGW